MNARCIAVGWLCAWRAPPSADDAALRAVEACRARLDPRADIGIERVRQRCPELMPALREGALARSAAQHARRAPRRNFRREPARAGGAGAALARMRARNAARREPRRARRRCSPSWASKGKQGATRWERFKRWLQAEIRRPRQGRRGQGWLDKWRGSCSTSEGVARVAHLRGLRAGAGCWCCSSSGRSCAPPGCWAARVAPAARAAAAAEWRRRLHARPTCSPRRSRIVPACCCGC